MVINAKECGSNKFLACADFSKEPIEKKTAVVCCKL